MSFDLLTVPLVHLRSSVPCRESREDFTTPLYSQEQQLYSRQIRSPPNEHQGVIPLAENDPDDEYLYEVVISTGLRENAGTKSKVCFVLAGMQGETAPKELSSPDGYILARGNVDRFLLSCKRYDYTINCKRRSDSELLPLVDHHC
ncbi:unnamed protein product [Protopolystoma xenopodis]|uniref:PLAT domain-containing protein n=1 Tax=Protopolystoma xenopodis TaxID=117903 RepID=A0A3S4ZIE4_9PLAT|nr:unnamed protein product [Protopolystoma xenopodis]